MRKFVIKIKQERSNCIESVPLIVKMSGSKIELFLELIENPFPEIRLRMMIYPWTKVYDMNTKGNKEKGVWVESDGQMTRPHLLEVHREVQGHCVTGFTPIHPRRAHEGYPILDAYLFHDWKLVLSSSLLLLLL